MDNYVVVQALDIVWHPVDIEESDNSLPTTVNGIRLSLTPAEMDKSSVEVIENKIEEMLYSQYGYRPESFDWEYVD